MIRLNHMIQEMSHAQATRALALHCAKQNLNAACDNLKQSKTAADTLRATLNILWLKSEVNRLS